LAPEAGKMRQGPRGTLLARRRLRDSWLLIARILIVEDSAAMRTYARAALEGTPARGEVESVEAASRFAALRLLPRGAHHPVHTLKGLAGLFGANRMASLSHELEELLDNLRLGRTELTASVLDLLFRSVELYGIILQAEKDGRDQAIPQVDDLIRELQRSAG